MSRILYAAGTMSHVQNFHLPYIKALREDGHEVVVMAKGSEADINIPFVKKMFSIKNLVIAFRIRGIIKRGKFDTVVLNTTLAAFDVRFAMPKRNRPKVINFVHGYMFVSKPKNAREKIFLLCERLLRKKTDSIMVMNAEDYRIATEYRLCLKDVKMTLGMGVEIPDKPSVSPELIRRQNKCERKYIVCFVGELCRGKNQQMLIYALREIKNKIPGAVLWLVGEGESRGELVRLADRLNLSDSVYFMGRRGNPCDYIRACNLYASASKKEGLPFNIIEALGCKSTVVASDIKGHRDIIKNGKSGFLFKPGSIRELSELILAIYRGEIAINTSDAVQRYKTYSFDNVFEKTYGTMKELIDK